MIKTKCWKKNYENYYKISIKHRGKRKTEKKCVALVWSQKYNPKTGYNLAQTLATCFDMLDL